MNCSRRPQKRRGAESIRQPNGCWYSWRSTPTRTRKLKRPLRPKGSPSTTSSGPNRSYAKSTIFKARIMARAGAAGGTASGRPPNGDAAQSRHRILEQMIRRFQANRIILDNRTFLEQMPRLLQILQLLQIRLNPPATATPTPLPLHSTDTPDTPLTTNIYKICSVLDASGADGVYGANGEKR